jgi:hypothetical protein
LRLASEDSSGNATFLAFNQTVNGIDVFNGQIKFTLSKAGEVTMVTTADVVPGLDLSTTPGLNAAEAVQAASRSINSPMTGVTASTPVNGKTAFLNPRGGDYSPITAELVVFPMRAASALLAYRIFIEVDGESWYEILVDANSGGLLLRHNLYRFAQANVWAESPAVGTRRLVVFPDPSSVNPSGWLSAEGTVTTGNNVDAYLDATGDGLPDNTTMHSAPASCSIFLSATAPHSRILAYSSPPPLQTFFIMSTLRTITTMASVSTKRLGISRQTTSVRVAPQTTEFVPRHNPTGSSTMLRLLRHPMGFRRGCEWAFSHATPM